MNNDSSFVPGTDRYDEIDAARGIAVLMMILYHALFDLAFFGIFPVTVLTGFWRYFAFATASLFLLIAGVSLTISHARAVQGLSYDPNPTVRVVGKYLRRGAGIFACGLLVTLATWLYLGGGFVVFGILHLIGVSIMLSPLFFRFRQGNIVIGALVIAAGIALAVSGISGPDILLPLGMHSALFYSVDYTPLFPWFGVVLVGLGIGERIYPGGSRAFPAPQIPRVIDAPLTFLGRHSLIIYLVHQPVIILLLHFISGVPSIG
jgi:uncharacterized membrane protein